MKGCKFFLLHCIWLTTFITGWSSKCRLFLQFYSHLCVYK